MSAIRNSIVLILLLAYCPAFAQTPKKIVVPRYNDEYSKMVAKLESGNTTIDYRDFRFSFLESKQLTNKKLHRAAFDSLQKAMQKEAVKNKFQNVIDIANRILSIDYTDGYAQKFLYQSLKYVGDSVNYKKYQKIQQALLKSVVRGGKGSSCDTPWEAAQVDEEHFVLDMIYIKLIKQSVVKCGNRICDKLEGTDEYNNKVEFYFDVTKMTALQKERDEKQHK